MAPGRLNSVGLIVVIGIFAACSCAQNQDSSEVPAKYRKWLTCDVDWIFTPYDVGRDFPLKLSYHNALLPGIKVTLTGIGSSALIAPIVAITDSSGTAWFSAVPPGKYSADVEGGLFFPSNEITVKAATLFGKEISVEWPLEPLPVRMLRGQLFTAKKDVTQTLSSALVQLVNLRDSEIVETQRTSADGLYEFSTSAPGLYVVRVIPSEEKEQEPKTGDLAVELDPAAKEFQIPGIKVVQSECAGVQLIKRDPKGKWEDQ